MKYLLIFSVFFLSCTSNKKNEQTLNTSDSTIVAPAKKISIKTEIKTTKADEFEIARVDYREKWIQRIFVVIDSASVYD
ncbi:MAG: hypothetical protein ACHQF2_08155, partial [Flavobacteriales bacterium]